MSPPDYAHPSGDSVTPPHTPSPTVPTQSFHQQLQTHCSRQTGQHFSPVGGLLFCVNFIHKRIRALSGLGKQGGRKGTCVCVCSCVRTKILPSMSKVRTFWDVSSQGCFPPPSRTKTVIFPNRSELLLNVRCVSSASWCPQTTGCSSGPHPEGEANLASGKSVNFFIVPLAPVPGTIRLALLVPLVQQELMSTNWTRWSVWCVPDEDLRQIWLMTDLEPSPRGP